MILLRPYKKFNFDQPSRVADACREISEILADGRWHDRYQLINQVSLHHGLKPQTVDGLLYSMTRMGDVKRELSNRRGRYSKPHLRGDVALADKHLP